MTDISSTLDDWFTTEGDAMTRDEYEAGADADGERRMQRALDDEHDRRVATGLAESRERWFRDWAERGLAPLGLAHGMAFDAGWAAALRAAEPRALDEWEVAEYEDRLREVVAISARAEMLKIARGIDARRKEADGE
jgi:hypothetical protein